MATHIFGVDLNELMTRNNEQTVPSFVIKTIRYLNTHGLDVDGIFRISSKISNITPLKQRIDNGEEVEYTEYKDIHIISSLFKLYFRELPDPLFTFEAYPKFISAHSTFEASLQRKNADSFESTTLAEISYIENLRLLVDELPPHNKSLAEILFLFLVRVGEHSAKNKMTTSSLATVWGQTLFRPQVESLESMMDGSKVTSITKTLLEKFDKIFPKRKLASKPKQIKIINVDESISHHNEEEEKLRKAKISVDNAIGQVQKDLSLLSNKLKSADQLDSAIDIAKRVRTVKKLLFPTDSSDHLSLTSFTLSSASAERQGKRKKMEDSFVRCDDLRNEITSLSSSQKWAYYAVYDGHGGSKASKMCQMYLHKNIIKSKFFPLFQYKEAIIDAFEITDKLIIEEEEIAAAEKDGSTAVIALLVNSTLYVANVGDSEAVLCKLIDGKLETEVVSVLHRPTTADEKNRIESAGGAVFSGRVFGKLSVSRALGDGDFKVPTSEANFVSSEPHISIIHLTEEYQFILLGCDGLFDKVTPQEAIEFLYYSLKNVDLKTACSALADLALERGSSDNVSLVLAYFNWN